jgi:Xaa-Pro dipeptidase
MHSIAEIFPNQIPPNMYPPHQAERLTAAVDRAGVSGVVATSPENVAYLTGFRDAVFPAVRFGVFTRAGVALVVPASDVPGVVTDGPAVDHLVCFGDFKSEVAEPMTADARLCRTILDAHVVSAAEALEVALGRLDIHEGSVGFDESWLPHDAWKRLSQRLVSLKLVPAASHLEWARRVKGPYEIECLGEALRIAEESLDVIIQTLDRGMTEREAAILYRTEVTKRGASPSHAVVAMGARTAIPAPRPTDQALAARQLVRFDVGCVYKGYCSSVARVAVLGQPTSEQEVCCRAMQAGLEAAVTAVVEGRPASRVFRASLDAIRANGLPRYDCYEIGHGIGLGRIEPPTLCPGDETQLEMGEVIRLETSHFEIASMGLTLADTVLVTGSGARVLNRSHHGLVVLD